VVKSPFCVSPSTMPLSKALSFFVFSCTFDRSMCVEPLAALAVQPVWQAGEPMAVNVDYDVPAFGPQDAALKLQLVSNIDRGFPARIVQSNFVPDHDQHGPSSFLATRVLPVDASNQEEFVLDTVIEVPAASFCQCHHARRCARHAGCVKVPRDGRSNTCFAERVQTKLGCHEQWGAMSADHWCVTGSSEALGRTRPM
jgi:hypothetical protein